MPVRAGPPLPGLHDLELASLAASGERLAFGELARRHGSLVRGLLRRMGADPTLADDLAQDAFVSAYEHISDFRGESTFSAWIRKIAARLYLRHWRRRARLEESGTLEDVASLSATHGGEGELSSRLDLDLALEYLSPSERLCVSLCYGAGLSHAEAAESLKAPVGTIKSHLNRGLAKLRTRLVTNADADLGRRIVG